METPRFHQLHLAGLPSESCLGYTMFYSDEFKSILVIMDKVETGLKTRLKQTLDSPNQPRAVQMTGMHDQATVKLCRQQILKQNANSV